MKPVFTDTAAHYQWGDNCDGWHLVDNESLSVIEELVPGGKGETRHFHELAQQFFYVLKGSVVIELDGDDIILNKNMGLHVPAGVPHRLHNRASENARFLVISQPKSHGDRVNA